ncbi:MAG: ABC transporter ATP-binding protein [Paracoccus sp. (in: a-proteobacteria)]|nr:ABC transporter ATP-binding protein [Paracoccus sp. (in: a-proteobacteria)]
MSHSVELIGIGMTFGSTRAVSGVDFKVEAGEFFSILGPSGCGKTTILRMIAGFIEPTEGTMLIGDRDMKGLGPNQRPTAMIFQSLALFPLMTVRDNIAFGLEARGIGRATRRARADELLRLVALEGYGDRRPGELSGGQRQRVAIARALAVEPGVLLLDEPLSALDLKLRQHMRAELRSLQKRTGVTFIYITHDQSEALAMSDRVAVMSEGLVQQVASPRELYDNPATNFVARFVGETNAISGQIALVEAGQARIDTAFGSFVGRAGKGAVPGAAGTIYIRPEAMMPHAATNFVDARIERVDFEGAFALVHGRFGDGVALVASVPSTRAGDAPPPGAETRFGFAPEHAVVLGDG